MSLTVVAFAPEYSDLWDAFCQTSVNGTFLHTRRFLSYHGNRFEDFSVLLFEDARLLAILPAARSPRERDLVVSHPGLTYGGFVHKGKIIGSKAVEAFRVVSSYYIGCGFSRLLYKPVPHIYSTALAQDDVYALFRLAARRESCDLSCAIDLISRLPMSERRRRGLKKAKAKVTLSGDVKHIEALWSVVEDNLNRKHGLAPVHSLMEIRNLMVLFPEEIIIRVALEGTQVIAGLLLFLTNRVWHAQYTASSMNGYANSALDAVFDQVIGEAHGLGVRYFDFGTSTENSGMILNTGLYQFKTEFGGGGLSCESFELDLFKAVLASVQ